MAGTITELNPDLAQSPDLVNTDPYGKGWMIRLSVKDPSEVSKLLDADAYASLVG